ncbi:MAG: ATP-dependent zinc protease [Gammaproteobacteria bacterium]|nr:ATP-dependent zinc protease [Gammaproteobacteria bacterium]
MTANLETNDQHQAIRPVMAGWREWVSLPDLGLPNIKAKMDTGARTSCLHAFSIEPFKKDGNTWVRIGVHPHQNDKETEIFCEAQVIDERMVTDSGGHQEKRYVISTNITLADISIPVEITLTNRDNMRFRMLIGRTAMDKTITIDPSSSYLLGEPVFKPKNDERMLK